ncbi:MAG: hypothetical protein DMG29_12000 [Acidobacteria bacterium]|nr:MAG: hypothetical protein DMG29_12000 [Acidobacteriota bacterium]
MDGPRGETPNCQQIERLLVFFACEELSAEERAAVEHHVGQCPACAASLASELRLQQGLGGDRAARGKAGPPRPSAGAVPQRARRSSRRCGAKAGPGKVVTSGASGKLVCAASGVERSAADSDRHGSGLSGTAVVLLANDTATRRRDNESFRAAASLPARLGNDGHRSDQLEGRRQFWVAQRRASPDRGETHGATGKLGRHGREARAHLRGRERAAF